MNTAAQQPAETYGIHLLKVSAILLQVLAHSYLWSVQKGLLVLGDIGTSLNHLSYSLLSTALIIPMTAGAVLRMTAQVDLARDRVINIDWRAITGLCVGLALIESLKQMAVYHGGAFFSWNVLHLIAISIPLMLWIGSYSIRLVGSVGLSIMLVTPAVIRPLTNYDLTLPINLAAFGVSLKAVVLITLISVILFGAIRRTARSASFAPAHRKRFIIFLGLVWAVATALLLQIKPNFMESIELATLPVGIIAGSETALHIWGFFPWAGSILLGFYIYGLIIRTKASRLMMWGMVLLAIPPLLLFLDQYVYDVTSSLSATAFFNGYHFNRTPEKMLLVIPLFMLAVPLFIWLARKGFETPYVVLLSRYVLWLYIYQTTLLIFFPSWVQSAFGGSLSNLQCMMVSTTLSFGSALALPAIIKRIPLNLRLQMKKNG